MRTWSWVLLSGWLSLLVMMIWKRPRSFPEILSAAGAYLPKRLVRKSASKMQSEKASVLFSNHEPEKAAKLYVRFWWGLWYCGLIFCGTLCFGAVWLNQQRIVETEIVSLERPDFGSEDRHVFMEMEAEENGTSITNKVQIRIPAKNPSKAEIQKVLDTTEAQAREYFSTCFLQKEAWPGDMESVQVVCLSEEEQWIDPQGRILWDEILTPVDAAVHVMLTAYGEEREFEVVVRIDPRQETLEEKTSHMLDRLDQGEYVTETAVSLPTEDGNGVTFTWAPVDQRVKTDPAAYYVWLGLLPLLPILLYQYRIRQKTIERRKKVYRTYPDMLNQFMILLGAGMSITKAWEKMDSDYRSKKKRNHIQDPLYEEMLRAENRMRTGYSFAEAVRLMAEALKIREIKQFASILTASWKRGDDHVLVHLKDLHDRSWEIRKNQARKASEEADTKLLLPLMMMLIVVIIIVLSPALMTMTI